MIITYIRNKLLKPEIILMFIFFTFLVLISNEVVRGSEFNSEININKDGLESYQLWYNFNLLSQEFTLGKKSLKQGPGYFSQLMLSGEGPPLPVIMNRSEFDLNGEPVQGKQLIAFLGEGVNKQLFVHRLENSTILPGFKIAISEAMVASELIHPAYYIPLSYWPYYLTAKLIGIDSEYNRHEDKYIGIDFTYSFPNQLKVYGELLVDEFPQHSWENNPDKRAHLLGLSYRYQDDLSLRLEYSNVYNDVYHHRFDQNNYTYDGQLLGHQEGEDSETLEVGIEKDLRDGKRLRLETRYVWKGIGSRGEVDIEGLSGEIVERKGSVRLGCDIPYNSKIESSFDLELGKRWLEDTSEDILKINCGLKAKY